MEVLKALAAASVALALASCELLSPVSFAQTVSDMGITPTLVQSVETSTTVGAINRVLGFVGGGGRVWIVTYDGFYGYDAQTLQLVVSQPFPALADDSTSYRFESAVWNYAAFGTSQLLWTRVAAPAGAGYVTEILTIDTTAGASAVTHTNADVAALVPIGNKAGTGWKLQTDPTGFKLQFDDTAGPGLTGPINTVTSMTFDHLQTSSGAVFAASDSPPVKVGDRQFTMTVQEWPLAVWGTAGSPSSVSYHAQLPASFQEVAWAAPNTYGFRVLKAGGHTFLVPTFGANSGNNTTTSVVVVDDATRNTVASQFLNDSAQVAVDSGDGWFLLGPPGYSASSSVALPLRKYRW
jgi:hypothetical protein